jgi:hypothetical protein
MGHTASACACHDPVGNKLARAYTEELCIASSEEVLQMELRLVAGQEWEEDEHAYSTGFSSPPMRSRSSYLRENVLIVFDWDDTLMCTSEQRAGGFAEQADMRKKVDELELAVLKVLQAAMRIGTVIIVTNADARWVWHSAKLLLPSIVPILKGLQVVSAKEAYQEKFPTDYYSWKAHAFQDVLRDELPSQEVVNLVSIGDSLAEINAAEIAVQDRFDDSIVKTIKLKDRPTTQEIVAQLEVVAESISGLVGYRSSISYATEYHESQGWRLEEICPSWCSSADEF